jgi:ACDE family multidrug resistance protein
MTAGVATGPLLAGIFSTWDWRYTFIFIGVLCILCNIAILRTYSAQGFRPAGDSWTDFLKNIPRGLRNHGVVLISVIGFLNFFCYIGALSYVSDVLSKPPMSLQVGLVGAMVAMGGLTGIFAAPMAGRLVDRIGRGTTASLGLIFVFLSTVLLMIATDIPGYALGIAMLGGGSQILWAPLFTLSVELDPPIKGTVSSIFNCTRFMGYAISPLLLGPIYLASGFDAVLFIGGCVLLAALAFSLLLRNR